MIDNMYYDSKSIYNLLLINYPKYETLFSEVTKLCYRQYFHPGVKLDCYVNVNNYLKRIYNRPDYKYESNFCIISSLINFAAHIKSFFYTRFSTDPCIILVYGTTRPGIANSILPEYDAHNAQLIQARSDLMEAVNNELNVLETLYPYIPKLYFIREEAVDPAVIIRETIKYREQCARLIFSSDLYDYQLPATTKSTHIVRTKKTKNGDKTYILSYSDFYKKLGKEFKLKNPIGIGISPELYSLYMTFSGCRDRNIHSIIPYPRTNKIINDAINAGFILNGYNPSLSVYKESFNVFENYNPGLLYSRYILLDLIQNCNLYSSSIKPSIIKGIIDQYDFKSLNEINNKYFRKYPLDLGAF